MIDYWRKKIVFRPAKAAREQVRQNLEKANEKVYGKRARYYIFVTVSLLQREKRK